MDRNWKAGTEVTGENPVRSSVKINLEVQDNRFALDRDRKLTGVLTIRPDRINTGIDINVENLNSDAGTYKLFFMGRKDGASVYKMMGKVVPDRRGHVDIHKSVDAENVDGHGTPLSCFYIFAVAAAGDPMRLVLKGDLVRRNEQRTGKAGERKRIKYNSYYSEYIRDKIRNILAGISQFKDISPFGDVWLACNWKQVTDLSRLPVASIGAEQQAGKYGHFIFASSGEHFYLAVPGRHNDEEWPDRGKSGFVMWQSIRNSEEYGYWCMVIDSKTGIITEIS